MSETNEPKDAPAKGELEMCPFCGNNPGPQYDADVEPDCGCLLFNDAGPFVRKEIWNNAYCWQELAKAKEQLSAKEKEIIQLNTFIGDLKQLAKGKQDALENSNAAHEQTFEALKESQAEQVKTFDKISALESRVKALTEALTFRKLKEDGKRNPFGHNCHWCSNCVSKLCEIENSAITEIKE